MSDLMSSEFNPIEWLKDFKEASERRQGFRELRAEIYKQTVQLVKSGGYTLNGKSIILKQQNVTEETVFFEHPEPLENVKKYKSTAFSVIQADCLETAELLQKAGFNVCVLNMANRQNPGGGVLGGAGAQEENLFRRSNLFMSLYQYRDYAFDYGIERSRAHSYPLDRSTGGIYSKDVTVFRGSENNGYCLLKNPCQLSFVSVPAINRPQLDYTNGEYCITESLIEPTKEKIRTILRISGKFNHDCIVLSAFGCGAFCNPPAHIATLFREVFNESEFFNHFRMIVFSIIDDHNSWKEHNPEGNVLPFLRVFDR